jgi:hypothetical protein
MINKVEEDMPKFEENRNKQQNELKGIQINS